MAFWGLPLQKKTSMLSTIVRKALSHSVKEQRRLILVLLSFRALGASIAYFRVSAETPPLFSFFIGRRLLPFLLGEAGTIHLM
ncbi:hypothetical protein K456DRAFT_51518, partial [Colletotrichum gloeosporioides 23]